MVACLYAKSRGLFMTEKYFQNMLIHDVCIRAPIYCNVTPSNIANLFVDAIFMLPHGDQMTYQTEVIQSKTMFPH